MLKLEAGKFYKTRDGNKRGPIVYCPEFGDKPYGTMRDEWWSEDGLRTASDGTDSKDLVTEWQEVAMEPGTLKELNVKPGDVVEWLFSDGKAEGTPYTVEDVKEEVVHLAWPNDLQGVHVARAYGRFRIISRATPTPDLTAITTPFGLLDDAPAVPLGSHGGPYEYWYEGEWHDSEQPLSLSCWAWRVKLGPIIESIRVTITNDEEDGSVIAEATVTTRNGKPDWATLQVHND